MTHALATCPHCAAANKGDYDECDACEKALAWTCDECEHRNWPDDTSCRACGHRDQFEHRTIPEVAELKLDSDCSWSESHAEYDLARDRNLIVAGRAALEGLWYAFKARHEIMEAAADVIAEERRLDDAMLADLERLTLQADRAAALHLKCAEALEREAAAGLITPNDETDVVSEERRHTLRELVAILRPALNDARGSSDDMEGVLLRLLRREFGSLGGVELASLDAVVARDRRLNRKLLQNVRRYWAVSRP